MADIQWNWTTLCGPGGLQIWSQQQHDLGLCFQQLFLHIPVLSLLAISSAFYFGRQDGFVTRGNLQLSCIKFRSSVVLILALLPVLQIYIDINKSDIPIRKISYFFSAVQGICWFTHFLYNLGLKKRLGLSPRGPVLICVLWSLVFVLTVISLRSHYLIQAHSIVPDFSIELSYYFSIFYLIAHLLYLLSLCPGEGSTTYINFANRYTEISENQPLLGNAYVRFSEEGDPNYLGVAMEDANWFSKLLFYWVNPLMDKGVLGRIKNSEDLYDLPISLNSSIISNKLEKAYIGNVDLTRSVDVVNSSNPEVIFSKVSKISLIRALHKCFWVQFYGVGILKFIADSTAFAGPILLNKLVGFIEDKSEDISWGYIYAVGLMSSTIISSLCDTHFSFLIAVTGLKMRSALISTIYKKTVSVSSGLLNVEFSVGEIMNFMSTDTDRIVNSCPSFHSLWSIPFQLVVTLYLLYSQVGVAFLAGVIFSIILIPINKFIASKIGQLSTKLMEQKDSRVKITAEVLRGIRSIKFYVWEQHFIRLILKLREKELKYLKWRKYLDALCVYFWATTPVMISILTFGTYVLLGHKLTAATVFTGMALLNMLISPLNAFPWVLNGLTEAWVSLKRIQKFLNLSDLDFDTYYQHQLLEQNNNTEIIIKNASFTWGKQLSTEEKLKYHNNTTKKLNKEKGKSKKVTAAVERFRTIDDHILEEEDGYIFNLSDIEFHVKKGEFVGVIGSVGCGKSSMLSAILGELPIMSGEIGINQIESGFGFVTQQPWLQRGTIKENILFGKVYDETKYRSVLFACGLMEDIRVLPGGDATGVGEGGMTLSGGQKARVALARAVYQEKSVYLLDDILSAVDVQVAKHIFQHCIMGLLKEKTRVLCTHHLQFLVFAHSIVLMEHGRIKMQGKPVDVLTGIDDSLPIDLDLGDSGQTNSTASSLLSSIKDESGNFKESNDTDSILDQEISETGSLQLSVFTTYWKSIGHFLGLSILIAIIMMQLSRNMSDWWLAHWVTVDETDAGNSTNFSRQNYLSALYFDDSGADNTSYYLKIYIGFAVLNTVFTLFRAFLFAYGGIVAATKLHKLVLKSIVKAKLTFFDITPIGRILNRFSSDTYTIDDSLPFILNILLAQLFSLLGSVLVTIYGLPWICLVLVPLIPVYHWLQHHYRLTSRELKRISSVTLSPVYNHFNETLQGLTTIRAMRASQRFKRDNEDIIDANLKAQFASQAANRWLGLRLQFIGVAIVTGVSFIAVVQHQFDVADPGLIGLAISYALSVTGALSGVVNAFTETEREMIAVERVNQYIDQVEPENFSFSQIPPFGWPNQGVIAFNSVVLQYREHLLPSLKGVTFETRPSEKIGIVGRTGAGKSSLVTSLFRLVEISDGVISIDSVNIKGISITALRNRMFCIPQDPFLFSGSIRDNLDPLSEFKDNEIWCAINKVNLTELVKKLGGLTSEVMEGGNNFSVGQKQLFCLARAVLHNTKILCIDEATANVDHETDRQIQQTLRSAFKKCTVLTIAHRIQTILDCDRVLVMSDGQIVEFDHPDALMSDSRSHFYQLINQE